MEPIVLSKYLDKLTVNRMLCLEETGSWEQGKTMAGPNGTSILDLKNRIVSTMAINLDLNYWVRDLLFDIVSQYNNGYNIEKIGQMSLLKYDVGGKYDWHQDVIWKNKESQRKLTMIVQLSDKKDYDGGDLLIKDYDMTEDFKEKGTIIIFPSNIRHKITPVTRGVRHSIVSWVHGPYCPPSIDWR